MPQQPDRQRLKNIFALALEQPRELRVGFLHDACGDDPELRREVESLLAAYDDPHPVIEREDFAAVSLLGAAGKVYEGKRFGHYRIAREIGRGGMGAVFLAERADGEFEQRAALKVVRRSFADPNLERRFRRERQILATLSHENIARLLDGGVSEDGDPYLVMEYVEGVRIDDYCGAGGLSTEARLRLFLKVCEGVAYAHRRLVVHRDIKPSNVLVTSAGVPKLLDFGIAKLLDPERADEQTRTEQRAFTPEYAAPEQVAGGPVTTSADVYSLGVLLLKLLQDGGRGSNSSRAGQRPPEGGDEGRTVATSLPTRPEGVGAKRGGNLLGSELRNIVAMATREEAERRYATVAELAEDVRRYLSGLPVRAQKDSFTYRAGKFARRNRVVVAASLLVALSLVGGVVATAWQARRAGQQRARAERRFNEIRRLSHSLMFEIHDSVQNLPGSTPTRQLIVSRALEYLDSLAQESGDDPSLQRELATAYEKIGDIQGNPYSANLGDTDGALASYRKALSIREALGRAQPTTDVQMELGRSYRGMGDILEQKGEVADCLNYYRRSLSIFESLAAARPSDKSVQDELARAYGTLGDGLARTDNAAERLQSYKQALAIRESLLAQNPSDAKLRRSVSVDLMKVGGESGEDKAEATEYLRRSVEMLEALSAENPQDARARREVGFVYYRLGYMLTEAGDYAGALESRRKAFDIRQEIASRDPLNKQARFDLAVAYGDLSEAYVNTGDPAEGLSQAQRSLEILKELSDSDPTNAIYMRNVGICYEKLAQASALSASDPRAPSAQRVRQWREAQSWYQKASDLFSDLRDRSMLMPTDAGQVEKFAARAAESEKAIEQLTAKRN